MDEKEKRGSSNEDIKEILTLDKSLGQQGKHLVDIEVHVFKIEQLDLVLLLLVIKKKKNKKVMVSGLSLGYSK